jgi:hypothetical protein
MVVFRLLDDIDYFVVMACCYFNYYLCYLYMLSLGCKPIHANQLNLANNLLKSD